MNFENLSISDSHQISFPVVISLPLRADDGAAILLPDSGGHPPPRLRPSSRPRSTRPRSSSSFLVSLDVLVPAFHSANSSQAADLGGGGFILRRRSVEHLIQGGGGILPRRLSVGELIQAAAASS
ncbi:hypothetical protein LINGRAHAP2_LOCUS20247 [Linum grandiflorum]